MPFPGLEVSSETGVKLVHARTRGFNRMGDSDLRYNTFNEVQHISADVMDNTPLAHHLRLPHVFPTTYAFIALPCRSTSYNPKLGLRGLSVATSPRPAGTRCDITVDEAVGAPARYRYMYTPLEERAAAMEKGLLTLQVGVNTTRRSMRLRVIHASVVRQAEGWSTAGHITRLTFLHNRLHTECLMHGGSSLLSTPVSPYGNFFYNLALVMYRLDRMCSKVDCFSLLTHPRFKWKAASV